MKNTRFLSVWMIVIFVAISLVLPSTGQAGTKYYVIGPYEFNCPQDVGFYNRWNVELYSTRNDSTVFFAPIHLPDGAKIIKIVSVWTDRDATKNEIQIHVCRVKIDAYEKDDIEHIADVSSTPGEGLVKKTKITAGANPRELFHRTIDNKHYKYYARVELPANGGINKKFHSLKIIYTK